jgi:hypothetical protein
VPKIMLLTSVSGSDGVSGDSGEVLDVPAEVAEVWADGTRAERWRATSEQQEYRESLSLPPKPGKDGA